MKKMSAGMMLLIVAGIAVMITGCAFWNKGVQKDVVDGGTKDTSDQQAPKEIHSEELVSFRTGFFRYADDMDGQDGHTYTFEMKKSEDGFVITGGYEEVLQCDTDAVFAGKLEKLIREYDLIRYNGVNKKTYGLPPEFDPYWIKAEYASGETLQFSMNGDPEADWTLAVLQLFAREFADHGIENLLPPAEDSIMIRFRVDYTYGDIRYRYSEILEPIEGREEYTLEELAESDSEEEGYVKKLYAAPWDRAQNAKIPDERRVDPTEEHYRMLQEIVEECGVQTFANGEDFPSGFDYEHTAQYFAFYIEYASGRTMRGFSEDPDVCEAFKPAAESFARHYEEILGVNQ